MVPDPIFNDFCRFLDGFLVAFCVRPLVCHHVFCNGFGIFVGLFFEFPHLSATNHQNKKRGGGFCAQRTEIYVQNKFTKMKNGNDLFSINKIHKSLDMNFISIKKHEMEILIFWHLST